MRPTRYACTVVCIALLAAWHAAACHAQTASAPSGEVSQATELRVFALMHSPVDSVSDAVRQLFGRRSIEVSTDVPGNRLLVRGSASQLAEVEALLLRIDSPPSGGRGKGNCRVAITVWEIAGELDALDRKFSRLAGNPLPLVADSATLSTQVLSVLAEQGDLSNPVSLRGFVVENQTISLASGVRTPIVASTSRGTQRGAMKSYSFESIGAKADLVARRAGDRYYLNLKLEDSRFCQADEPAKQEEHEAADLAPRPPTIASSQLQTTLLLGSGDSSVVTVGGGGGGVASQLLVVVSIAED